MNFDPVKTLDDLDSLDEREITDGYMSAERGDPEPGPNRGRAFWHGWRCRMFDYGLLEIDADHRRLAFDWVKRQRLTAMKVNLATDG
jgi:hypothetical protein